MATPAAAAVNAWRSGDVESARCVGRNMAQQATRSRCREKRREYGITTRRRDATAWKQTEVGPSRRAPCRHGDDERWSEGLVRDFHVSLVVRWPAD